MVQYNTLLLKFWRWFLTLVCIVILFTASLISQTPFPDEAPIYQDDVVARIDITLPADSLAIILAPGNEESDYHFNATFSFDNGTIQETVENIGFRLRGNTSRYSAKKSFKVSFNTYEPGRTWYGVEKLNLNGEHNDPTISRSKVCWDLLRNIRVPAPRSSHVNLYINGEYYGIYINVEHIDEEFAKTRFGNKNGNLYKCLWPADLDYLGNDPDLYKFTAGNRRAYELTTNEETDDYSDLANFIDILNNTPTDELTCELEQVFNINSYLRSMAFDILSGNWDGPLFNKNNFYLYRNQASGKFEYIPYDLDNTFGIDWFNVDWVERDMYEWGHPSEPRPLYWRLLEVPEYRNRFSYYMQKIVQETYTESNLFSQIDAIKALIQPYVSQDGFYPLDYGFSQADFNNGFTQTLPYNHTKVGLKPFISDRRTATLNQLEINEISPIIDAVSSNHPSTMQEITIQASVEDDQEILSVQACFQFDGSAEIVCVEMYDDGLHQDGEAGDGQYGTLIPPFGSAGLLTYYIQASDSNGNTSQQPACSMYELFVGSASVPLAINEFMASNSQTIMDEEGEYEDWVELYNYGNSPIFLGGLYLSDNQLEPTQWPFPDIWIEPYSYLLIWTDDDENQGSLHTNFKLSADGEFIGIFDNDDNSNGLIDGLDFGPQDTDQAFGRLPNGTGNFQILQPTPGSSNQAVSHVHILDGTPVFYKIFPNPAQDVVILEADRILLSPKSITLFNGLGQLMERAIWQDRHQFNLSNLPSGLYYIMLEDNHQLINLGKIVKK